MDEIFKAISRLLTIKNLLLVISLFAVIYFIDAGKIETAVLTTAFSALLSSVISRPDA